MPSILKITKLILKNIYLFFRRLTNTIYYLSTSRKDILLIDGWFRQRYGKLVKRNFGDELNVYLLEALTGKKVICARETLFFGDRFLVIGSLIEKYSTAKTYIWGSGAIDGNNNLLREKPLKVCAVRGKLSQEFLYRNDVKCPDIFGDPALLLPLVYQPKIEKKYRYGIIPHVCDIANPIVTSFLKKNASDVHLISFMNYGDWQSVIDEINSCEKIISSSLHGLIISDAYKIPNVWITISDNIAGGEYKYMDYFSGVDREYISPIKLTLDREITELEDIFVRYKTICPNIDGLLQSCPFKELISLNINKGN